MIGKMLIDDGTLKSPPGRRRLGLCFEEVWND